jgi:hypothetical protein
MRRCQPLALSAGGCRKVPTLWLTAMLQEPLLLTDESLGAARRKARFRGLWNVMSGRRWLSFSSLDGTSES